MDLEITNILTTILLWSGYLFTHSFLASEKVKRQICSLMYGKAYRLFYSSFSVITILPLFYYLASTPSRYLVNPNDLLKYISMALCTWGIIIVKQSFKHYSLKTFLGIKPESAKNEIIKIGLYKYVRHPLYSGMILLCLGFWLFIPNLLNLSSITTIFGYLVIAIPMEEKKLTTQFGADYLEYKERTPAVFPDLNQFFER